MADRKKDHIELAFRSQMEKVLLDERFYYEPLLGCWPSEEKPAFSFLGKTLQAPIWVSSMTGGTKLAGKINRNLARACAEFGMGMGLGSCRSLLENDKHFNDFNVRHIIGHDLPLYANFGICQLEKLIANHELGKIVDIIGRLQTDGAIVHINPIQEWLQPEGDKITQLPIETLSIFLDSVDFPVIVKEVGQGIGPESLLALMQMPLQAIEFAAFGGTNFAKIEIMRHPDPRVKVFDPLTKIGHSADQMVGWINDIVEKNVPIKCNEIILSGGIENFLDGYYLMQKCSLPSIYGQAATLLKYAKEPYKRLQDYLAFQKRGLEISQSYLKLRNPDSS